MDLPFASLDFALGRRLPLTLVFDPPLMKPHASDAQLRSQLGRAESANRRIRLRIQPVDATIWLNISAGVWKSRVFLGRSFNLRANALSLACE